MGQVSVALMRTPKNTWVESEALPDIHACYFLCQDLSTPNHLQLSSTDRQRLRICPPPGAPTSHVRVRFPNLGHHPHRDHFCLHVSSALQVPGT